MADNMLSPGAGGVVSGKPSNDMAVPPSSQPTAPPSMPQHYASQEDELAGQFAKVKEVAQQAAATRNELESLLKLGDTVTSDDVVKAASGLVAAGIGAPHIAGILADMPEGSEAIQTWVQGQYQQFQQQEAKIQRVQSKVGHALGVASLKSIIAHSAEAHHQRRLLAASVPSGRMN